MMVVDTSALMAICLGEDQGPACMRAIERETFILVSAGTLAEALVVAGARGALAGLESLMAGLSLEIVPVTGETAVKIAEAYRRWGKGFDPAKLNLGDCFAYALAKERACPLLFIGNDFAKTDIASAIGG